MSESLRRPSTWHRRRSPVITHEDIEAQTAEYLREHEVYHAEPGETGDKEAQMYIRGKAWRNGGKA